MEKVVVNFRKQGAAAEFAENFPLIDAKATVSVKGRKAVVSSSDPRTVEMVRHMARNVIEDLSHREAADAMLEVMVRASSGGRKVDFILADGSPQSMNPMQAEAFARTHDLLSEWGQTAFLILAGESRESYEAALGFALRNEERY